MVRSSKARFREFLQEYRAHRGSPSPVKGGGPVPPAVGGEPPAPTHPPRRTLRDRWPYVREYGAWLRPFMRRLAIVFALALSSSLLSLILPWATMQIIDRVIPARDWRGLHLMGGGLLAIIAVQQTLDVLRNWRMATLNASVMFRLRHRLFRHLLGLPLHELSNMKTGGITSRLSGDVDTLSGVLQMALLSPGVAGVKVTLTIVMLMWINWRMALSAVVLLPPVVLLNMVYIRRIRPIYTSLRKDRSDIDGRVVETFGGIRVVRAFRREPAEARRYAIGHHLVIRKQLLARLYESVVWAGWGFLLPLSALFIIWFGGVLVLWGHATVGGILAFQMYLLMLLSPVSTLVQSYGETQQALAALERVFELLRKPTDKPDRPGARGAPRPVRTIEFHAVDFAYRDDQPVLRGIDLRVPGGAIVALVGPSGSGKTTLTHLVARFYDPTAGAIRLNGVDLRDIRLRDYRALLALVQQDVFLFDGTIAENIAYGRLSASRDEIESAARRANADAFIRELPDGYETLVGERGIRLSGGQAQRVSIARALLADPEILILDEATSSLDTESEQLIQAAMRELLRGRTTFIIAHRLSTVADADLIVVLDQGAIIETGSHAELMSRLSRYREMVERQRRGLAGEAPSDQIMWSAEAATADLRV